MIAIKEMPYQEKYEAVMKNIALYDKFMPEFVRVHLGEAAVDDLQQEWQKGIKRLPIAGSPQDDYETAYENWIWMAKTNFRFVRQRMGEEGVRKLEQTELHALIQQNKGWPLIMLNLVRLASPGSAFKMLADQMRYDLQWLTPYVVTESNPEKLVVEIDRCKILDYKDTEDVCQLRCQQIYPQWVANQFMADLSFERSGHRCTCILRPLDWPLH